MMTSSTRAHVLVRTAILPDEWPETYLVSLARAQGLRKPWGHDIDLIRSVLPWEKPSSDGVVALGRARRPYLEGRPQYGSMPLPPWASVVRAMPLRYCPHCLVEKRYFRTRWRLSGFQACTAHGCLLKSDLVDRALTVNYTRKGLLQFKDANDERILSGVVSCSPRELAAVSMVWQPLEQMAQQSESPREDETLGQTACWSVLLWRLLEEISRAHHKKVIKRPTMGPLAGVARLIEELGVVTAPSLDGMLALFAALRENIHVLAAKRFLDTLIVQEDRHPTALSTLPLTTLRQRLMSFAPVATPRTAYGEMAFRDLRAHAVNKSVLLEELAPLGAGADVVDHWIRANLIPTTKLSREGMSYTFVERTDVLQARRAMLSLIHARDFAAEHSLDWRTYKAIRDTSLLSTGALGLRGYLYRKEIVALTGQLELMSAPVHGASTLRWQLFCESTFHIAEQRSTFVAVVKAALRGQIQVYRDLSKPGLSAFSIGVDGIAWLAGRRRAHFCERRWRPAMQQPGLFDAQEQVHPA